MPWYIHTAFTLVAAASILTPLIGCRSLYRAHGLEGILAAVLVMSPGVGILIGFLVSYYL